MKVLLPVKNNKTGSNEIAEGFHSLDYVCVFDDKTKEATLMPVTEISETVGHLTYEMKQQEILSIITMNITPMVLAIFRRNDISVYKAQSFDVSKNISLFEANQLKTFKPEESRLISASCSSSSCSSCSSTCN